ncbi:MAG: site-2 protease family protein [Oscillospiraceae bacterium]|jgi:Zn-dependent protease|nr:site-2 protease family protein [Oscillospiraceae bacterium]
MTGPLIKLFTGADPFDIAISFFAVAVLLLIVLPLHECAHGYMAKYLGDDTAERAGRLTLNPLAHLEPMGALFMLFIPIGWGKPVPVDERRCDKVKPRTAAALIAAAGPLSNLVMAYVFVVLYKLAFVILIGDGSQGIDMSSGIVYLPTAFYYIAMLNIYLAVFNLFPIPPFDGWNIIQLLLKPRQIIWVAERQNIISLLFLAVLFITPVVIGIISFVSGGVMNALDFLTGFIH